ncbi:uncharacterized protein [Oscarella lobularis]|uniref:uncharacterized protein n=1 Tax=Oscarella lobularis TaxID=121494 RepID=UPI0033137E4D
MAEKTIEVRKELKDAKKEKRMPELNKSPVEELTEEVIKAKNARQNYLANCEAKYVVDIRLRNSTPYVWALPQTMIIKGSLPSTVPPSELRPNQQLQWMLESKPTGDMLTAILVYAITENQLLAIQIKLGSAGCLSSARTSGWLTEIIDVSDPKMRKMKRIRKQLGKLYRIKVNEADCSAYRQEWPDAPFLVFGNMGSAEKPVLYIDVHCKIAPPPMQFE